jgi:hypothetical protein
VVYGPAQVPGPVETQGDPEDAQGFLVMLLIGCHTGESRDRLRRSA